MADLRILKKDGYEELDGVQSAVTDGALDIKKLWRAVAQADTTQAAIILFEAGFELDDVDVGGVKDVILISTPDDISGEHHRVWVKLRK